MRFLIVYNLVAPRMKKVCHWFEEEWELLDFVAEMRELHGVDFKVLVAIEILEERKIEGLV